MGLSNDFSQVRIRPAQPQDWPALAHCARELIALHAAAQPERFKQDGIAFTEAEFAARLANDQRQVLVAENGRAVYAFVAVRLTTSGETSFSRERRFAFVTELVVRQPFRRRGIGRKLLAAAFAWVASRGVSEVDLLVSAFDQDAIRFYEAMGFTTDTRRMTRPLASEAGTIGERA